MPRPAPTTLTQALEAAAASSRGWRFVDRRGRAAPTSFSEMLGAAEAAGAALQALGLAAGDRVGVALDEPAAFMRALFGVLLGGGVPVPLCSPSHLSPEEHRALIAHILQAAGARLLITTDAYAARLRALDGASLPTIAPVEALGERGLPLRRHRAAADDLALLQFTSGSTARPRGVRLSHRCLLANIRASSQDATPLTSDDVVVSWLPLYHDLGLIVGCLGPVVNALPAVVAAPRSFIGDPALWLRMIATWGGTVSWAPNHGYRYAAAQIEDRDVAGLDLSRWRIAGCAGEPVRPQTLARFARRFAPLGFDERAFVVAYGLAEFSLGATFTPVGRGLRYEEVDLEILGAQGRAGPARGGASVRVTACGRPLPGHEVAIVDDSGAPLPERQVGHIWLRGPSRSLGYEGGPEHQAAFADGWLVTGDDGYLAGGELYVCGRQKDTLALAEGAVAAEEIEGALLEDLPGASGQGAAFTVPGEEGSQVVLVVERDPPRPGEDAQALAAALADQAAQRTGGRVHRIVLVSPGALPRTTSGKIRRAQSRHLFLAGRLAVLASAAPGGAP